MYSENRLTSVLIFWFLRMTMNESEEGPDAKKAKLFAPPSVEEISDLRESEGLYSGRLNQLKVDEILREVSPSSGDTKEAEKVAFQMMECFKTLKEEDEFDLSDSPDEILGVKVPIAMAPPSNKGRVKFRPPSSVRLVRANESIKYGEKIRIQVRSVNALF